MHLLPTIIFALLLFDHDYFLSCLKMLPFSVLPPSLPRHATHAKLLTPYACQPVTFLSSYTFTPSFLPSLC
ncbi:hypothetical protein DE146DRAFT_30345 [Phaeosphaeria sp. MPI-PUGE-AT-0046c]|nr:hypothetical protein DE146DRAFT_30345 [Phaeosphaeria sp. MPI-PUGE-AT-0046c]